MLNALEVVKKEGVFKRAAEEYGVPETTLQDRVLGNVEHSKKLGQQPYLNQGENVKEERDLAKFDEVVADIRFGKTRSR